MNIGIIGAGKAGSALGLYLKKHGLFVVGYYSRRFSSAEKAAQLTETEAFSSFKALADLSSIIIFATPDRVLKEMDETAASYVRQTADAQKKIWIHLSGALPSDCLASLKAMGCPVGSMHPLQSFGTPEKSAMRLEQTSFSIEGTPEAEEVMRAILQRTGGRYNRILAGQKPLYHAGACIISNYLVTLLHSGMRYMEAAGYKPETIYPAIEPLILGTLQNLRELSPEDALTGPIARGDLSTVSVHLDAIQKELPEELAFYRALALKTVSIAQGKRLNLDQAEEFQELLKGDLLDEQ